MGGCRGSDPGGCQIPGSGLEVTRSEIRGKCLEGGMRVDGMHKRDKVHVSMIKTMGPSGILIYPRIVFQKILQPR